MSNRFGGSGFRRGLRCRRSVGGGPLWSLKNGVFTRSGSRTYLTGQGVMAVALTDVMRFEDRGDGNGGAWVLEGGTTNEASYSDDHESWTNAATVTGDQVVAPDGTTTVDDVEDDSAGAFEDSQLVVTGLTASTEYCMSQWIKKDGSASHFCEVGWTGTHALSVRLTDGSKNTRAGSPRTFDVYDMGDWWWVVWTENTTGTSHTYNIQAAVGLDASWPSVSASGTGVTNPWGLQFEKQNFPTSLVPTSGSPVSCGGDLLNAPAGTYPDDIREGVWEFDWFPRYSNVDNAGKTKVLIEIDSAGASDDLYVTGGTVFFRSNGVNRASRALTWGRENKGTIKIDRIAEEITFSNFTTGNGTVAITGGVNWGPGEMYVGRNVAGSLPDYARYTDFRSPE